MIWQEELEGIRRLGGSFILTMHPQVIGRPSRIAMLDRLIDCTLSLRGRLGDHVRRDRRPRRPGAAVSVGGALVTGAAGGIGAGVARRLADDGWSVVLLDRGPRSSRLRPRIEAELGPAANQLVALEGDVSVEARRRTGGCDASSSSSGGSASPSLTRESAGRSPIWSTSIPRSSTRSSRSTFAAPTSHAVPRGG